MLKNKHAFLFLASFLIMAHSYGQNSAVNAQIEAKIALAKSILFSDMKRSARIIDAILVPVKKYNRQLEEASLYNLKGIILHFSGKQDSSLLFLKRQRLS